MVGVVAGTGGVVISFGIGRGRAHWAKGKEET